MRITAMYFSKITELVARHLVLLAMALVKSVNISDKLNPPFVYAYYTKERAAGAIILSYAVTFLPVMRSNRK